jgi:hypothetical protein
LFYLFAAQAIIHGAEDGDSGMAAGTAPNKTGKEKRNWRFSEEKRQLVRWKAGMNRVRR